MSSRFPGACEAPVTTALHESERSGATRGTCGACTDEGAAGGAGCGARRGGRCGGAPSRPAFPP